MIASLLNRNQPLTDYIHQFQNEFIIQTGIFLLIVIFSIIFFFDKKKIFNKVSIFPLSLLPFMVGLFSVLYHAKDTIQNQLYNHGSLAFLDIIYSLSESIPYFCISILQTIIVLLISFSLLVKK